MGAGRTVLECKDRSISSIGGGDSRCAHKRPQKAMDSRRLLGPISRLGVPALGNRTLKYRRITPHRRVRAIHNLANDYLILLYRFPCSWVLTSVGTLGFFFATDLSSSDRSREALKRSWRVDYDLSLRVGRTFCLFFGEQNNIINANGSCMCHRRNIKEDGKNIAKKDKWYDLGQFTIWALDD